MGKSNNSSSGNFIDDIKSIIDNARQNAVRSVDFCRVRVYPIANALRSQLNWTQYRRLIQIEDPDKREYYELESVNNGAIISHISDFLLEMGN